MIHDDSRYRAVSVIKIVNKRGELVQPAYLDLLQRPKVRPNKSASVVLADGDSLHAVSLRRLGKANYWWAIATASGIQDPFTEAATGIELEIPDVNYVQFHLLGDEIQP